MSKRKFFKVACALALGLAPLLAQLAQPCLLVRGGGRVLLALPLAQAQPVTIFFIHSVQKTPVWENLVADGTAREFRLVSTRYQSFGVGLPFFASEGEFRQEGDYFIMDKMDRHYRSLSLRTGVGTRLTLETSAKELRLYEMFPPGTRIDLTIGKGYEALR